ncbi:hypothetical protein [Campylobacter sp.]|uniref:hypothetical protein n=1 Tax=Campylobacter sp. TaxID=205 RepID=UPI00259CD969|nr:hypothetical protein [Campylobacter sp.]MBQ7134742.1 hypothetical protein [Campylobacter sp.]
MLLVSGGQGKYYEGYMSKLISDAGLDNNGQEFSTSNLSIPDGIVVEFIDEDTHEIDYTLTTPFRMRYFHNNDFTEDPSDYETGYFVYLPDGSDFFGAFSSDEQPAEYDSEYIVRFSY